MNRRISIITIGIIVTAAGLSCKQPTQPSDTVVETNPAKYLLHRIVGASVGYRDYQMTMDSNGAEDVSLTSTSW